MNDPREDGDPNYSDKRSLIVDEFRDKPARVYFVTKHGKPVASYGTGGVGVHMADEHIAVEEIIHTTKVYALTMLDLLGAE